MTQELAVFDGPALLRALDRARLGRSLRWAELADSITAQSAVLRARTGDHDLCAGALVRTVQRGTMSCQYALMLLRWLDQVPERFLSGDGSVDLDGFDRLPAAGADQRLRWDLPALYEALQRARAESGHTWATLGSMLACTPNRLTNLKAARDADMGLVMRITQWLGAPSVRFIHAVDH